MSTRSTIIVHLNDGNWKSIYCHFDGYPSHNGKLLLEHYNSQELAEAVVAPGDMSSLNETCATSEYYGRDRGETNVDGIVATSLEELLHLRESYTYIWDGAWSVNGIQVGIAQYMKENPDE